MVVHSSVQLCLQYFSWKLISLIDVTFCSWTAANRDKLEEQNSCLEFKLHRLQFTEMVANNPQDPSDVLRYAKQFARFAYRHTRGEMFNPAFGIRTLYILSFIHIICCVIKSIRSHPWFPWLEYDQCSPCQSGLSQLGTFAGRKRWWKGTNRTLQFNSSHSYHIYILHFQLCLWHCMTCSVFVCSKIHQN